MPYPIIEHIEMDVEETLRGVQIAAGYGTNLIVERSPRKINPRDSLAVVLTDPPAKLDGTTSDAAAACEGAIFWKLSFEVLLFITESQKSHEPINRRINIIRSDVEKAIMIDPYRGGFAHYTRIEEPARLEDANGALAGVAVRFSVDFATRGNDPYVLVA